MIPDLFKRRFVVIAGKGGVGRTTVSAALAIAAARAGLKVLLCQTKAKERLSLLFGVPAIGSELVRVRANLWAVNMLPSVALREYGAMVLHSEFIAKQVLENRMTRAFLQAVPGIDDYAMLGKAWFHTTEEEHGRPKYDLVILDGPATGHVLSLLAVPDAILKTIPEGPLTASARATHDLLRDKKRSAFVIVTLAEDMPSNEAVELARRAELMGLPLGPLIVNGLFPPRFQQGASARGLALLRGDNDAASLRRGPLADETLVTLVEGARLAERRRALNEQALTRLRTELRLPQVQLPFLFRPDFSLAAVSDLADRMEGQLAAIDLSAP